MNKRINELAEQCRIETYGVTGELLEFGFDQEKFAELIVKECVSVVEGGKFLHDQAPTALFAKECSGAIKQHFGVEE
jgi:hypothetical protein